MRKKKVIVSVTTDLISDQRVHKTCLTLYNMGYDVLLIGRKFNNIDCSEKLYKRPYSVKRFSLIFNKGFLFYAIYNIRLLFFLMSSKFDILLSNDLDTLAPNFIASRINKKPLVYDSHELFTEVPELTKKRFVKSFWLFIENLFFPRLHNVITISDGVASFYSKKYNTPIKVVRNVPFKLDFKDQPNNVNLFKSKLAKYSGKKIIYQGSLNKDRGIELMIQSMEYVDAKLFIIGNGDVKRKLELLVQEKSLADKVVFLGRFSFEKLSFITIQMDLGFSFEEDVCLSYRYSLPNKIFDYVHAEVPVLVSNLPEMSRLVEKYQIGEVLKSREPKKVACQINELLEKKDIFRKSLINAKNHLCWEKEQKNIISLFKTF